MTTHSFTVEASSVGVLGSVASVKLDSAVSAQVQVTASSASGDFDATFSFHTSSSNSATQHFTETLTAAALTSDTTQGSLSATYADLILDSLVGDASLAVVITLTEEGT